MCISKHKYLWPTIGNRLERLKRAVTVNKMYSFTLQGLEKCNAAGRARSLHKPRNHHRKPRAGSL